MEKRDVVVVGASCAGLFLADLLARGGVSVSVYDQVKAIGPPFRSLIVTGEIEEILGFRPAEAITNEIHHIRVSSPERSVKLALKQPDLILERAQFLRLLAERTASSGARIYYESPFQELTPCNGDIRLRFGENGRQKREVRADLLIAADGLESRVANALGKNGLRTVWILQVRVSLPSWIEQDTTLVWFDRNRTKYFYWFFPESETSGVIGIISEGLREAREQMEQLLKAHDLHSFEHQIGQVPLYQPRLETEWPLGRRNVILMGDTAGQVKVTTMGGVMPGLKAARAIARSCLKATPYKEAISSLKKELTLHHLLRRFLNQFGNRDYDLLIRLMNEEAKETLTIWNRDQIGQSLWRVLRAQPLYFLLGIRSLPALVRSTLFRSLS